MSGMFLFSLQEDFARRSGRSSAEVGEANGLIGGGHDASRRLLWWAFEHRRVSGPKKTEISLSPRDRERAAVDLELSLADVSRLLRLLEDEGKLLAAKPGFIGRVPPQTAPIALEPPPADWNKVPVAHAGDGARAARTPGAVALPSERPPLPEADRIALELRAWALRERNEPAVGGYIPTAVLKDFAAAHGYALFEQVQPAADLVRKNQDFVAKLLDHAMERGRVGGPKNTRLHMDEAAQQSAAAALGVRPEAVAEAVEFLTAQGQALDKMPGVLGRVPRL